MKFIINIRILLIFITVTQFMSCKKNDELGQPGKVELLSPANNEQIKPEAVSDNKVTVIFEWTESNNTEEYDLVIKNLETGEALSRLDLITTSASRALEVGYQYSWTVTSKNSEGLTTISDSFTFSIAEEIIPNTPPPTATLISPSSGASLLPINGKVTLQWESETTDADGDALTFTVYADTVDGNQEPPEVWRGITEKTLEIEVEPNQNYYWRVETSDSEETTTSEISTFSTIENVSIEGTIVNTVQQLLSAIGNATSEEKIYVRGGVYTFSAAIDLNNNGTANNPISLLAYSDDTERPKFDFSSMSENSSNRAMKLRGNYWHIKGIDVFGAGDNGMYISGNNNLIEFCTFSECSDTGLQLGDGASNNTVLNCDSYYNADSSIENADGFACKLDAGDNNKFIGCRAWQNLDDGYDGYLRGTDNITTTYENCWAIRNGYLKDGSKSGGDGNGFKTGGSDNKDLKHHAIFTNCLAIGNVVDGFDHNSNRGTVTLHNCSAYDNGKNYSFGSGNALEKLIIKNSNVLGNLGNINAAQLDVSNNSWQDGISVSADDFVTVDYAQLTTDRKSDGSLPDVTFFNLTANSDMIDKGVDVGLPYNGSAPDLGAFEFK